VLLFADIAVCTILLALYSGFLLMGYVSIGFRSAFRSANAPLFCSKPPGFGSGYFTGRDTLPNAGTLGLLAGIGNRCLLCVYHSGGKNDQHGSQQDYLFHTVSVCLML
jgi:hypothetical protein